MPPHPREGLSFRRPVPYNGAMSGPIPPPSVTAERSSIEREVLHKDYRSGTITTIGLIIERRRLDRGRNFFDLLRKARLRYGGPPYDIGAIFLGSITTRLTRLRRRPLSSI